MQFIGNVWPISFQITRDINTNGEYGIYFLRASVFSSVTKLDIMMRKKGVQHVDTRQLSMIENAYFQV